MIIMFCNNFFVIIRLNEKYEYIQNSLSQTRNKMLSYENTIKTITNSLINNGIAYEKNFFCPRSNVLFEFYLPSQNIGIIYHDAQDFCYDPDLLEEPELISVYKMRDNFLRLNYGIKIIPIWSYDYFEIEDFEKVTEKYIIKKIKQIMNN